MKSSSGVNEYLKAKSDISSHRILNSPLFTAARTGNYKSAVLALRRGDNVNERGEGENTPLVIACEFRRSAICKLLLESGADVNLQNTSGCSALHKAAYTGLLYIIKLLANLGADLNIQEREHMNTPLHKACEYNQLEAACLLISLGADTNIVNHVIFFIIFDVSSHSFGVKSQFVVHIQCFL